MALPGWQVCLVSKAKLIELIVPLSKGTEVNWKEPQDILSVLIEGVPETIGGNLSKAWFSLGHKHKK